MGNSEKSRFIEKITIGGKVYEYVMTSDSKVLESELKKLDCQLPCAQDYRYNPALSPLVRQKMAERKAVWSITTSNGVAVLNYYSGTADGKGTPYIVWISELIDSNAISKNYIERVIQLVNSLGEIKFPSSWSPLMFAIAHSKPESVKILLENGSDPNFCDENLFTPLMLTACTNNAEIAELLIKHGADVNLKNKGGFSALLFALYRKSTDVANLLCKNGANLNITLNPKVYDKKKSFVETLDFYIGTSTLNGLGDISLIYKHCGMSKQTFSKIRSKTDTNYHPRKNTVLQLAIGLRLTLSQTENFLESAGYLFDEKNPVDKTIKNHISHLDFDIFKIDSEVFEKTGKPFLREEK